MNIVDEILKLKKSLNAVILVHNYQRGEIQDIGDYLGDSLGLSKKAAESPFKTIVFCGVKFMAETAKILSPEKTVLLPRIETTCPMADMVTVEELETLKSKYPDAAVVSYVNTNADVKAMSDVCCTSANAVKVVQNVESASGGKAKKIIFIPDKNLADYVSRFTDKEIIPWNGYCYVHASITPEDIKSAKEAYKNSPVIVHPECKREVIDLADEVLSTGGMVKFAKSSAAKEIIIGTEEGIIYRLKKENPDKNFYTAGPARMCKNMKLTTLEDVYLALSAQQKAGPSSGGKEKQFKVELPDSIMNKARTALTRMLEYA